MSTGERRTDKMRLLFFMFYSGAHNAAWRHPDAVDTNMHEFSYYRKLTETAEKAKFDAVFVGDSQGFRHMEGREAYSRLEAPKLEPFTLLSALSVATTHIGVAGTVSTSYNHPYTVARKFASLDHISSGRAGWNVVTSSHEQEARNFGRDSHFEHGERYQRAHEFLEICKGLWDSWDDDALVRDKESGLYFDPDKLHGLFHEGRFFKVEGPLNVARSPQGYPVIVQAGSSADGQALAAAHAEVVFTSQPKIEGARKFYADVKAAAAKLGRNPDHVKICPSIQPLIASSEAELARKDQELADLVHIDVALSQMQHYLGSDVIRLSDHDVDGPLPDMAVTKGNQTFQKHVIDMARKDNLTIREIAKQIAAQRFSGGFRGTPEQVADSLEEWFQTRAADGFCVTPALLPSGLDDFCDQVVPILQKRGLFREEYEYSTLRENLGLPRPVNQHVGHPELHREPAVWASPPRES
jgi:FMN-dependent oxidoreductase (nitrilotriacetate monooxygenase family)